MVSSLRLNCYRKFTSFAFIDSIDTWACEAKGSVIREEAKHSGLRFVCIAKSCSIPSYRLYLVTLNYTWL